MKVSRYEFEQFRQEFVRFQASVEGRFNSLENRMWVGISLVIAAIAAAVAILK